jgi:hypothetical protein
MPHHPSAGDRRRPEGARMPDDMEWLVPIGPVRYADRAVDAPGLPLLAPQRTARVAELRRLALRGYYASDAMMDVVARRLLASSDL